ncbi:MAG: hypothetical protein ACTHN7_12140 [Solirubrobacterales bacterium]
MIRRACIAAAAGLALLALPSAAAADGGGGASAVLAFRASSGYRVHVFATRTLVGLRVDAREGPGHAEALTSYLTRGEFTGSDLKADFGELGRVSMRFVPSSAPPSTECEGERQVRSRHGTFVGSLRFPGEDDYLGADVKRVKGAMVTPVSGAGCHSSVALGGGRRRAKPKHKLTSLYAGFRRGLDAVYFRAYKEAAHAYYEAIDESGGEQVAIYRYAYVEDSPLTFATDSALSFAGISPPYPFSGIGLLQRNPDGSRAWSGSLAASFPGDPDASLTGPQFKTQLLREW